MLELQWTPAGMRQAYGKLEREGIESTRGSVDESMEILQLPPPDWFMRHHPRRLMQDSATNEASHDVAENACCSMFATHVTNYIVRATHNVWVCRVTYLWLGLAPVLGTLPQAAALLSPKDACVHEEDRMIRLWSAIGTFAFCLPWPFLFHGLRKVAYDPTPPESDATEGDGEPGGRRLEYTLSVDVKTVATLKSAALRVAQAFTRGHQARLDEREATGGCCYLNQCSAACRETRFKDRPGALHSLRCSEWGMECTQDEAKTLFACFDKNNDGKITAEELQEVLDHLHEGIRKQVPLDIVKKMIAGYDSNDDGSIDLTEFVEMMLAAPKPKRISEKARNSLMRQALVMVGLGLLMLFISVFHAVGLVMLVMQEDQTNVDKNLHQIAQPAREVLDHFLPADGCVPDIWILGFEWLLLLVPFPATIVASFVVPAWLLSLHLGVALAADCVHDVLRELAPLDPGDDSQDDRLLRHEFTNPIRWERQVQHPVAMLVERMRHLSDWGTPMGVCALCYLLFAITMLPTVMSGSSWLFWVKLAILLIFFAIPFYLAWGPAAVSSACDDLLDQLNDLSFVGTEEHRARVARLRASLMNLQGNQGLGFTVWGTVVNRRMLFKIMLAGSSCATTVVTTVLTMASQDHEDQEGSHHHD